MFKVSIFSETDFKRICWKRLEQNKDYLWKSWTHTGIARPRRCDSYQVPIISKSEQALCNVTKEFYSASSNEMTAWRQQT